MFGQMQRCVDILIDVGLYYNIHTIEVQRGSQSLFNNSTFYLTLSAVNPSKPEPYRAVY